MGDIPYLIERLTVRGNGGVDTATGGYVLPDRMSRDAADALDALTTERDAMAAHVAALRETLANIAPVPDPDRDIYEEYLACGAPEDAAHAEGRAEALAEVYQTAQKALAKLDGIV